MKKIATKSKFSIDGNEAYEGFTFGQTWNGWACPYFELGTALKIAEMCSLPEEGYTVSYNAVINAFEMVESPEPEDTYNVEAQTINTVDGLKTVYALGAFGWVWDDHAYHNR